MLFLAARCSSSSIWFRITDSAASAMFALQIDVGACSSATCGTTPSVVIHEPLSRFLRFASAEICSGDLVTCFLASLLFGASVVGPAAGMANRSKRGISSAQSFRNLSTLESMLSNPMLSSPMLSNAR